MELTLVKEDILSQCYKPKFDFRQTKYSYLVSDTHHV